MVACPLGKEFEVSKIKAFVGRGRLKKSLAKYVVPALPTTASHRAGILFFCFSCQKIMVMTIVSAAIKYFSPNKVIQ